MKEITIPKPLGLLVQAFSVDDAAALLLIDEAASTFCKAGHAPSHSHETMSCLSTEELDAILALMKSLSPRDTLEMIYAAQVVIGHLMGMRSLAQDFAGDKLLGLKLLRFSGDALNRLQKAHSVAPRQVLRWNYAEGQIESISSHTRSEESYASQRN